VTSTTEDLRAFWLDTAEVARFPDVVFGRDASLPKRFETLWSAIPERLGLDAFIPEYVEPHLFKGSAAPLLRSRLFGLINEGYFASYANAYGAGFVTDLVWLSSTHQLRSPSVNIPYRRFREAMRRRGVLDLVATADPTDLVGLRRHEQVTLALAETLRGELDLTDPTQLSLPVALPPDLGSLVEDIRAIGTGRRTARRYHEAAERFFSAAFASSLVDAKIEHHLDDRTRRADIIYRNVAYLGFFRWMSAQYGSVKVVIECKNYSSDVGNPELDQTLGYLNPWRGRFAILACRRFRDRPGSVRRCRLAVQAGRGCVIGLDDEDLTTLAAFGTEPAGGQSRFLASRVDELID
jgi:hypothetical protein